MKRPRGRSIQQWTRTKLFLTGGFVTFGALRVVALFVESILTNYNAAIHIATIVGSVLGGVWRWRSGVVDRLILKAPFSDSTIEIEFGDILDRDEAVKVIPVNEYFDGELGDHVSERSLHGKLIKDRLGGNADWFYNLADKALSQKQIEPHLEQRNNGRCKRYPIGTTVAVDIGDQRFLLAALSHTDRETLKASASLQDLDACLIAIWEEIQTKSNGRDAKIPLVGSGLSGVGLPPDVLIYRILTSFFDSTKTMKKIADRVILILHPRLKGEVNLTAIRRSWSQYGI